MKKKLIVDILMFILMLLEFSRMYLPTIIHELVGIILLILVIIHLILNKNYLKNIFKSKYKPKNVIMLAVNVLLVISFMITTIFGLLSSQDTLTFMNINNLDITHLHKVFGYISLIIVAIHLGINFNAMFGKLTKLINNKIILSIIGIVIIVLGIYSFNKVDFWNHLIGKYGFGLTTGNFIINTFEYLSIIMMITIITNIIYKKIK